MPKVLRKCLSNRTRARAPQPESPSSSGLSAKCAVHCRQGTRRGPATRRLGPAAWNAKLFAIVQVSVGRSQCEEVAHEAIDDDFGEADNLVSEFSAGRQSEVMG